MMPPGTVGSRYCPGCGGPNPGETGRACIYCTTPLLPLGTPDPRHASPCSACGELVAGGASFCGACGHALAQPRGVAPVTCAGCGGAMVVWGLAPGPEHPHGFPVQGCRSCGGMWIDAATLRDFLRLAARDVPRGASVRQWTMPPRAATSAIVYRACPCCGAAMLRRNFARISGVIVDECRLHGTFFDVGELAAVLAFVRSGGLAEAQQRAAREDVRLEKMRPPPIQSETAAGFTTFDTGLASSPTWALLGFLARWLRDRFRS